MGVRSSWLMLARNWLLATLAASAAALACTRASSARLRSVMSCPCAMVEIIDLPSLPKMLAEFHNAIFIVPSFCRIGISMVSQYSPVAVRSIFCKDSCLLSSGKRISRSRPMTSWVW